MRWVRGKHTGRNRNMRTSRSVLSLLQPHLVYYLLSFFFLFGLVLGTFFSVQADDQALERFRLLFFSSISQRISGPFYMILAASLLFMRSLVVGISCCAVFSSFSRLWVGVDRWISLLCLSVERCAVSFFDYPARRVLQQSRADSGWPGSTSCVPAAACSWGISCETVSDAVWFCSFNCSCGGIGRCCGVSLFCFLVSLFLKGVFWTASLKVLLKCRGTKNGLLQRVCSIPRRGKACVGQYAGFLQKRYGAFFGFSF